MYFAERAERGFTTAVAIHCKIHLCEWGQTWNRGALQTTANSALGALAPALCSTRNQHRCSRIGPTFTQCFASMDRSVHSCRWPLQPQALSIGISTGFRTEHKRVLETAATSKNRANLLTAGNFPDVFHVVSTVPSSAICQLGHRDQSCTQASSAGARTRPLWNFRRMRPALQLRCVARIGGWLIRRLRSAYSCLLLLALLEHARRFTDRHTSY